jgi:nuclear protein localization family protein 4
VFIKKLQPYRHVDNVQLNNVDELRRFIELWDANARSGVQRAAFLYGRYLPDPNYRHGVRAVVEALYEPPQTFDAATGVVRMTVDPRQDKAADAVAAAAGLTRIGWLFTTPPRPADAPLLPRELLAMARLQNMYPRADGLAGSRFVTVVVSKTAEGIVPRGFQASDLLMALERDGVLAPPGVADVKFKVRQRASPTDPPQPDVIYVDEKRGNLKLTEVEPTYFVVTMKALGAKAAPPGAPADAPNASIATGAPVFKRSAFPVENRAAFGISQDAAAVKRYLSSVAREPPASRVSDFHLLLYLASALDTDTAVAMAGCAASGAALPEGLAILLEALSQ